MWNKQARGGAWVKTAGGRDVVYRFWKSRFCSQLISVGHYGPKLSNVVDRHRYLYLFNLSYFNPSGFMTAAY